MTGTPRRQSLPPYSDPDSMTRRAAPRLQHAWRSRRVWLAAAPLLLLAACGGGSSEDAGNTQSYDLDAIMTRSALTGFELNGLTARNAAGTTFVLSMSFLPQADGVFEGVTRKAVRQIITVSGGGSSQTSGAVQYFSTGPYADAGSRSDDGSYSVATSSSPLPTAARVGTGGPMSSFTDYANSSKALIESTTVVRWLLEADNDTTAYACQVGVITNTGSASGDTVKLCWRVDTAGQVTGGRVTLSVGGVSLEFR